MEYYEHIELTEEEQAGGLLWAKRLKDETLKEERLREQEAANRKFLFSDQWNYELTLGYMSQRAVKIFQKPFELDDGNTDIFNLLCLYFCKDARFVALARQMGTVDPDLSKGILLAGSVGVGKTWLMQLFAKNQRQVFAVRAAKAIADAFGIDGEEGLASYKTPFKLPANDMENFYQPYKGLCIDDIGTEEVKNHFGNKKNVIGDLVEQRYSQGHTGPMLHMTTNLASDQLKEFYGARVTSRIRETMNIIIEKGKDRRK